MEFVRPTVEFFIDGQPAGALKDVSARYLPIESGIHRVAARVGLLRSRGLILSLAPGELVSLECGFNRYRIVRTLAPVALMLGSLLFLCLKLFYASIAVQFLAVGAMVLEMVMIFAVPGSNLYLRRSVMPVDAATVPERMDSPSATARPEPGKRKFQFSVRALLILVACCALLALVARELWDRRPSNQAARAIRMLRSPDPSTSLRGLDELMLPVLLDRITPQEIEDAIPRLLEALGDRNPHKRESAARCLSSIVFHISQRSATLPQVQAIAASLAEVLQDTEPPVRNDAALALAGIYPVTATTGRPRPPLPVDTERFVDLLVRALKDPSPSNRTYALRVLSAIGPQASKAIPAILPLLDETFDSVTPFEQAYPDIADPAHAAAWALGAIAPGTNMAETSRARLKDFLARTRDPLKRGNATWALSQLEPAMSGEDRTAPSENRFDHKN